MVSHDQEDPVGSVGLSADTAAERTARSSAKMVRSAGVLSFLTLISRVLGLIREMTKARFLGRESTPTRLRFPSLFRTLCAASSPRLHHGRIHPHLQRLSPRPERQGDPRLSLRELTVLTICVVAVVALGIAFAPAIVKLFGSDPVETTILTRIMFPFLALVSFAALLQGILNSHEIFGPSGLAPILFNLCFIVVPWLVAIASAILRARWRWAW